MLTVVTGAPCSGKTTHVNTHAKHGDIVIDLDRIALAFAHVDVEPYMVGSLVTHVALGARAGAMQRVLDVVNHTDVWVIDSKPLRSSWASYRANNARVVSCSATFEELVERAKGRPPHVLAAIVAWFADGEQ